MSPLSNHEDELGMASPITRRDFLNATLLGTGAALLASRAPLEALQRPIQQGDEFTGYGGIGDYARSNGNTWEVVQAAHKIRDGAYSGATLPAVHDTGETFELIVVGAGFSGLGAAYFARKHGIDHTLVLDNHVMWGGEAKRNELLVDGVRLIGPQGSNAFGVARTGRDSWYYEMFTESGIPTSFEHQAWAPGIKPLPMPRDNHYPQLWTDEFESNGFFFEAPDGSLKLVKDIFRHLDQTPWPEPLRRDFVRWRTDMKRYYAGENWREWLDTMTYEDYIVKVMGLSPAVARWVDPSMAGGIGMGSDVLSATAAAQIRLPGFQGFTGSASNRDLDWGLKSIDSFPGGNDGIARHMVKWLIPEAIEGGKSFAEIQNGRVQFGALDKAGMPTRIRLGATVVRVEDSNADGAVTVTYAVQGKLYRAKGRRVVMANGGWSTQHVVRDLPAEYRAAYQWFPRAPMMVVNVAFKQWRFMYDQGITAVNYRDKLGFACNLRQNMIVGDYNWPIHPDRPNILTFTISFSKAGSSLKEQVIQARSTMLGTTYRDYERQLREQLVRLFGQFGFDPKRDIAGIILNRWGHAYCCPAPGFYYGKDGKPAARDVIRQPFGRIAFANAELNGHQNNFDAMKEGKRAVEQLLEG